jgi:hypothetical protein
LQVAWCKRPCGVCRRWFHPDPRVGARQRACSKTCSAALRKKTQTRWRADNAGYAIAWRIEKRAMTETAPPPRMPPLLARLPWDLAKDEFGPQGTDFIGAFGRLLVGVAKDEMRPQPMGIRRESGGLPRGHAKDEIGVVTG